MTLNGRRRLVRRLRARMDAVVQEVTVLSLRQLLKRTPRQTGRLASSWRVGIYHPNRSYTIFAREGDIEAATKRAIIKGKTAKAGDVVFLTNSAPHASVVEFGGVDPGSGKQRKPVGMVRITAAEMPHLLRIAIRKALR